MEQEYIPTAESIIETTVKLLAHQHGCTHQHECTVEELAIKKKDKEEAPA